mmetsp:Transcript_74106/g.149942  ORF Transcript_74106/g.149942 Transcript_74106/m.149942 type:complete len:205 (+) Transcript_74106:52-666(+)
MPCGSSHVNTTPAAAKDRLGIWCILPAAQWGCVSNRLHGACNAAVLDTALVAATQDLEVSAITPGGGPAVLDEPVRHAVLSAVADDLDRVAAEHLAGLVLVHAGLVVDEVGVHGHGDLERAVGGQLGHHGALTGHAVVAGDLVLGVLPVEGRVGARVGAGRRVDEVEARLVLRRAGRDRAAVGLQVRVALVGDEAVVLGVHPRH